MPIQITNTTAFVILYGNATRGGGGSKASTQYGVVPLILYGVIGNIPTRVCSPHFCVRVSFFSAAISHLGFVAGNLNERADQHRVSGPAFIWISCEKNCRPLTIIGFILSIVVPREWCYFFLGLSILMLNNIMAIM